MRRRPIVPRKTNPIIGIACEGHTEEAYLNEIKTYLHNKGRQITLEVKRSQNTSAPGVIESAKKHFSGVHFLKGMKVFCVFDKDANTDEQIQTAIKEAKKINAEIIFSNPSFEVWLFAHFKMFGNISQATLESELKKADHLGQDFKKQCAKNYFKSKHLIETALATTKHFESTIINEEADKFSEIGNPCTDMYKIIEYIQEITGEKL